MFITHRAVNSVEYVTSDIIKSRHAFSTRVGGVSTHAHTSALNLAFKRGDEDEVVIENLKRFGDAVGFDPKSVVSLPQIHSADVIEVDVSMRGEGYFKPPHTSCDGYVTSKKGIVLGVKTADCVPIILEAEDEDGNIIAVSAIHAGWRGTAAEIAAEGVKKLVDKGADLKRIRAAIGPSIDYCCFEVGEDFAASVAEISTKEWKLFSRDGKLYADLKAHNRSALLDCGLLKQNIDLCDDCTCCRADKYYSHRRMKGVRGTMLSVVFM